MDTYQTVATAAIGVGIFFAGRLSVLLDRRADAKKKRSDEVVKKYWSMVESHSDSGVSAFRKSGILDVRNEKEAQEIVSRIQETGHLPNHPFGKYHQRIMKIGVLKTFKELQAQRGQDFGALLKRLESP